VELEHRFEVPVGIDAAWTALLDMEQVGPCFPGAILDHVEGDEFSGSVKIKLGPIRMTYKGNAKIVEKDEAMHRARIEATGNAGGSTSTAAMMVTATAELIDVVNPDEVAADFVAPAVEAAPSAGTASRTSPAPAADLDLLSATAAPILKRVGPIILGIVVLILLRKLFRRHPEQIVEADD
jgi:carbon monoxide dehydrogenase subunit G